MIATVKAKMFLADQREMEETDFFISNKTFNEKHFSVDELYLLNDTTMAGGKSLRIRVEESSYLILLPVFGAIAYKDSFGNENLIAAGQIQLISVNKATLFEISNPFKNDQVNFLEVRFKKNSFPKELASCLSSFDVNEFQNSLIQISPQHFDNSSLPFKISIGKFSGRGETTHHSKEGNNVFALVLEGAFEMQGCLLHARDGLTLSCTNEIEIEALSNDALLLLIEL